MPDIPGIVHVPIPQIDIFAGAILYIITGWGRMDELMDAASQIMTQHPTCAAVSPAKNHHFNRRLAHFEALSDAYFTSTPAMARIVRQKCNVIRKVQTDRDLLTHGIYGIEFGDSIKLRLTDNKENRDGTRTYTKEELGDVASAVGNALMMFSSMTVNTFAADKENLENNWKIPLDQVDQLKTLLNHIQRLYHQTTLERLQRETQSEVSQPLKN